MGFYCLDDEMAYTFRHDGSKSWSLRLGMTAEQPTLKAGMMIARRVVVARTAEGYGAEQARACLQNVRREFGMGDAPPVFSIQASHGKIVDRKYVQRLETDGGCFCGRLFTPVLSWPCIPVAIGGLNDNWDAFICGDNGYDIGKPRRFPVRDGVGYVSLDTITADCRDLFMGHAVTCNHPDARLLVLESGPTVCEVQVHNPTDEPMTVRLKASAAAQAMHILPECSREISLPPGGVERVRIEEEGYAREPYSETYYAIDYAEAQGRIVQDLDATWLRAVRSCDKPGPMIRVAGQVRGSWNEIAPIGVCEPAGPMEMVVRLKLVAPPEDDKPVVRLFAVNGMGPTGWINTGRRALVEETIVASRTVYASEFSDPETYHDVMLRFERPEDGWMGYGVDWPGSLYVHADTITVRQAPAGPDSE